MVTGKSNMQAHSIHLLLPPFLPTLFIILICCNPSLGRFTSDFVSSAHGLTPVNSELACVDSVWACVFFGNEK